MKLTPEVLCTGCADESLDAGVTIRSELEPLGGEFTPVKPAIYVGGVYQHDRRWVRDSGTAPVLVDAIVIDNEASEANRHEAALLAFREALGLPELVLVLPESLPVHLPRVISSFTMPHRNGDAYLRDALLGAEAFPKSKVGRALLQSTPGDPAALLQWMPQALVYGFWLSHMGKKRQQTKHARAWRSEIVGLSPARADGKTLGTKGDPLNLSIDSALTFDVDDQLGWSVTGDDRKGGKSKDSLAELGHGQVPADGAPLAVSFAAIEQRASLSFAQLRHVRCATPEASAAGRALLAAIGIAGHVAAFGRAFHLRSGCDLRTRRSVWTWLGSAGDVDLEAPTLDEAVALVRDCALVAESAGLPVGAAWADEPLVLEPNQALAKVIEKTWPLVDRG
jgi:CRISPR-associated protein Csb1